MIKLTQYSHGAGCGCKISPAVLECIIHSDTAHPKFSALLVGNESKDDAAVFDLGNGECVVSTTDFFMPIVDDPFTFGSIAAVNAISDVYAMGGEPIMAIAILGWPVNKLPAEVAQQVVEGGRKVCTEAGIPLAGGHSIDCPEPVFGLAVTGRVKHEHLKRNDTARTGSSLYLTKPLGIGIVTTAQKKGIVEEEHLSKAVDTMLSLNKAGSSFGTMSYVNALTDITGFGLLGHLIEVCEGSGLSAIVDYDRVPVLDFLDVYIQKNSMPGGTQRNLESYGNKVGGLTPERQAVLADPQTSGGLLVCVDGGSENEFETFARTKLKMNLKPFGRLVPRGEKVIEVR